jgi:hypothetical protein
MRRSWPGLQPWKDEHLEVKAIQDAPVVEVGMFSVESHLAKVLFDIGATHSLFTKSWVEAVKPMIPPLRVNSVGGKFSQIRCAQT